jgi:exodeoxyribonuclease VII large subunit
VAVYKVSQVTSYMREKLEYDSVLRDLWVSGEVANLRRSGTGHSYFTLRDAKGSLKCVLFLNSGGSERLTSGAAVLAHGRVSIYEKSGDVQLIVDLVQPEGIGELQLKLEQLKLKLQNEGLFEPSRKRPLPTFPRRLAVVTSPTGAVWQDIQNVVARRYPLVELVLAPTPVQGERAASGIIDALRAANDAEVDIVIAARGGGSLEDLWPFNDEGVARAIYSSRVPVISAVGHETDVTIADMVADVRAPTPSAAAEVAVPDMTEIAGQLSATRQSMVSSMSRRIVAGTVSIERLTDRVLSSGPDIDTLRRNIDDLLGMATTYHEHGVEVRRERSQALSERLTSLSPYDTLRRGYAVVQRRKDGAVVGDGAHAEIGDALDITLQNANLGVDVTSVEHSPGSIAGE